MSRLRRRLRWPARSPPPSTASRRSSWGGATVVGLVAARVGQHHRQRDQEDPEDLEHPEAEEGRAVGAHLVEALVLAALEHAQQQEGAEAQRPRNLQTCGHDATRVVHALQHQRQHRQHDEVERARQVRHLVELARVGYGEETALHEDRHTQADEQHHAPGDQGLVHCRDKETWTLVETATHRSQVGLVNTVDAPRKRNDGDRRASSFEVKSSPASCCSLLVFIRFKVRRLVHERDGSYSFLSDGEELHQPPTKIFLGPVAGLPLVSANLSARSLLDNYIHRVDYPGNVPADAAVAVTITSNAPEQCEQAVDGEVLVAANLEEDAERRQQDRTDQARAVSTGDGHRGCCLVVVKWSESWREEGRLHTAPQRQLSATHDV
ncbi:hypothetical protein ON010_g18400 [Phytophthora cinnamomi]|nr:hypothetical protein ON010_g18400 [Phytophthora cinnamomi]